MGRFLQLFTIGILCSCMAACGGESTSKVPPDYTLQTGTSTVTPQMGGSVQGTTITLTSATVSKFAGSTIPGFTNLSTSKTEAQFNHPIGITTDGTDLYVADYENNAIRKISIELDSTPANDVSTIHTIPSFSFNRPTAITMDATNLYVADSGSFTIQQINISTKSVSTLAGTAGTAGSVDGIGTAARFNQINGITTDGTNLYVSDSNNTIRTINIVSSKVTTLAGTPGKVGAKDGVQAAARFNLPARLTTDGTYLYVADFNNRIIRRVSIATGEVITIAGTPGVSGATDTNTATGVTATFYQPNGITTDGKYLYVTDSFHNTIRKVAATDPAKSIGDSSIISPANVTVTTLAGSLNGTKGSTDGPASPPRDSPDAPALFNTPIGITTDGKSLYVADRQNNIIRQIQHQIQ